MNLSSFLGTLFGIFILYMALKSGANDLRFFLNEHGLLIVFGGTLAAASMSFPISKVASLTKVFLLRFLGIGSIRANKVLIAKQLLEIQKKSTQGFQALAELAPTLKHEFLREAVTLLSSGLLSAEEVQINLEKRLETTQSILLHDANMFRAIGKYPPAFGLLATTLGMISLLQKMGEPNSQKLIGPAMSIGLIGTLYGIALANMIFLPIAENLSEATFEEITLRRMMIEGVVLIKLQTGPMVLRERLNSYLPPRDRIQKVKDAA
jgi:chemotaxis protein MotA